MAGLLVFASLTAWTLVCLIIRNRFQFAAIPSGISPTARGRLAVTPELRNQPHQTMLFVFGP
jgi:hypothetical protein